MPDIRLAQSSWDLIDTLKRVWNFRVNYAPIRLAIGRSLLSGDIPDFELRGEDGRAIDTQQIFSGGGTDYTPLFRADCAAARAGFERRRVFAAFEGAR